MVDLFRSPRRLLLFLFEGALIGTLFILACCLVRGMRGGLTYPHLLSKAALLVVVLGGSNYYAGFYDLSGFRSARQLYAKSLQAQVFAALIIFPILYLVRELEIGREILIATFALISVVLPTWRVFYNSVSSTAGFFRRAIILGNGELAQEIAKLVAESSELGIELVGMLSRERSQVDVRSGVIGTYDQLYEVVMKEDIKVVLVAYPDRRGTLPVEQLLEVKFRGVEVEEGVIFYERMTGKIYVRELKPSQLIFAEGFARRQTTRRLKRMLDVICAMVGLILSSPLFLLTTVLIRLDSPGPIFYRQVRAGEFGRLFTIIKFRSMRTDAEKHGAQFAKEKDNRVTRVGRFIRKTRIDEIPQFWNVLKGEMSMVGPRPERPVFIEQLEQQVPFFKQRLYVKPGLTGHAQVNARYGEKLEDHFEKLQYDLYYIKSYSVLFDISILIDTVKVVLLRIGSR